MRKTFLKIHQLLGLATGIVVFVVSITGCLWVFKEEIQSVYKKQFNISPSPGSALIAPTKAKILAQQVFPGKAVHGTLYGREGDPVEVIFYEAEPEFYRSVFLDPYSGEVLHAEDHDSGFFAFVLDGHMNLWLPDEVGSKIVGISVLLFMAILISGIILWWPKKNLIRQRFRFDWRSSTRWKRKNYDLHAVTGFYIMMPAFILAFTGSIMSYKWFQDFTYRTMGGDKNTEFIIPENKTKFQTDTYKELMPIDQLILNLMKDNPQADNFEVHYPYDDNSSIYVEISDNDGLYFNNDYRFFDQTTLQEINTPGIYGRYKEANLADKIIRMNYDIHIGAIGGIAGKIIAFLISLLTATLPISGFIIWYGRYKKKNRLSVINKHAASANHAAAAVHAAQGEWR